MEREVKDDLVHLRDCIGHLQWGAGGDLPVSFDLRITKGGEGLIEISSSDPATIQPLGSLYDDVESIRLVGSDLDGAIIDVKDADIRDLTTGTDNLAKIHKISAVLVARHLHVVFKDIVEPSNGKPRRRAMYLIKGLTRTLAFSARVPPWTVSGNSENEVGSPDTISARLVFDLDDEVAEGYNFSEQCDQLVQRILEVLSVAVGASLVWSLRKIFVVGQPVLLVFRSTETVGDPWYPMFYSLNLSPVVVLALEKYTPEVRVARGIDVAVYWYLNTSQRAEATYLHLMTALEHMVTKYADGKSKAYFDKTFFAERIRPVLSKAAKTLEEDGLISRSDLEFIDQKLCEINRMSLRSNLEAMLREWGVYIDDLASRATLGDLVSVRNRIAHQGALSEDDKGQSKFWDSLDVLVELLKRIFMSSWQYEGKYISHLRGLDEVSYPPGRDVSNIS